MPPMAKRFLPTQEWSVSGRKCIGKYGIVAARCIVAATVAKSAAESPPFP